jgi:urate oxidase
VAKRLTINQNYGIIHHTLRKGNTMTKNEMASELAEVQVDAMSYSEMKELALEFTKQNLEKMSLEELQDLHEYAFGTSE